MLAPTPFVSGMQLGPRPEQVLRERLQLAQRYHGACWLLQHIDLVSGNQEQHNNYTMTAAHVPATQGRSFVGVFQKSIPIDSSTLPYF